MTKECSLKKMTESKNKEEPLNYQTHNEGGDITTDEEEIKAFIKEYYG